jgi:sterol 14alpha-demethylase
LPFIDLDCESTAKKSAMGLLNEVVEPVSRWFSALGTPTQVGVSILALILFSVAVNVAQQLLLKNPNDPPLVFHWFPFIGSTVTYGIDPPAFFKRMQAKVGLHGRCDARH